MTRFIPSIALPASLAFMLGVSQPACQAQPPDDFQQEAPSIERIVARMMAFDKNKDGKLTRDEITDPRLLRVFERADANHDGVVTKEELTDLAKKMIAEVGQGGNFGGPGRGFGGPDGGPPGGFGQFGPGRGGQPPQPGQVLSPRLQDTLKLTAAQKKEVDDLQKEVDSKFAKILTSEQKAKLKEFKRGGPPDGPPPDGR